jgi:hypothetical protein
MAGDPFSDAEDAVARFKLQAVAGDRFTPHVARRRRRQARRVCRQREVTDTDAADADADAVDGR